MIKVSDERSKLEATSKASKIALKEFGSLAARYAALPLAAGFVQYFFSRKDIEQERDQLKNSYTQLLQMSPKLNKNPEMAAARFQELCTVAPTVAKNPNMAAKFLEPRINKGLSLDDVHKLTMIQAHARSSILNRDALDEAGAKAGLYTDKMLSVFGPRFVEKFDVLNKQYKKKLHEINTMGGDASMKKQSSQKISDDCLAEMLADRFVMWRNSPLNKEAGAAASGAGAFKKGLAFFAAPLALAGLVHGAGMLIDKAQKKKTEEEALDAFKKIRSSEVIKGNPELAREAFDAIVTFAPHLAVKPTILKTFIEHTIRTEQLAPQTASELASAQANILKAKGPGFAHGFFGAAVPAIGLGKTIADVGSEQKGF